MERMCPHCDGDLPDVILPKTQLLNTPVEQLVAEDEAVREHQYAAAMQGREYRHSACIASNAPEGLTQWHA